MKKKDDLLPLLSHAQFNDDLQALIAEPNSSPCSLLFVDLDLFKEINDSYGHEAGDEALMKAADVLISVSQGKGDAYRRGGDEMAVILPNQSIDQAAVVAANIRESVERISLEQCNEKITVSVGIASYPETVKERARLFQLADTMMYRAKDSGGNCICIPPIPGQSGETILPAGRRYMRGDITSRVEAVELWMSLNQAVNARRYDIAVKNDNDEEVTVEGVALKFGALYLCNFSKPKESAVIAPGSDARISGEFPSDPMNTLRDKLEFEFSTTRLYELDIVVKGRVLGRVRRFSHTILAKLSEYAISQWSPQ